MAPKLTYEQQLTKNEAKHREQLRRQAERESRAAARAQIKRLDKIARDQERAARIAQREQERKALQKREREPFAVYGPQQTVSGKPLTPKQAKLRSTTRAKRAKRSKRILRRAWRRLI